MGQRTWSAARTQSRLFNTKKKIPGNSPSQHEEGSRSSGPLAGGLDTEGGPLNRPSALDEEIRCGYHSILFPGHLASRSRKEVGSALAVGETLLVNFEAEGFGLRLKYAVGHHGKSGSSALPAHQDIACGRAMMHVPSIRPLLLAEFSMRGSKPFGLYEKVRRNIRPGPRCVQSHSRNLNHLSALHLRWSMLSPGSHSLAHHTREPRNPQCSFSSTAPGPWLPLWWDWVRNARPPLPMGTAHQLLDP